MINVRRLCTNEYEITLDWGDLVFNRDVVLDTKVTDETDRLEMRQLTNRIRGCMFGHQRCYRGCGWRSAWEIIAAYSSCNCLCISWKRAKDMSICCSALGFRISDIASSMIIRGCLGVHGCPSVLRFKDIRGFSSFPVIIIIISCIFVAFRHSPRASSIYILYVHPLSTSSRSCYPIFVFPWLLLYIPLYIW